MTTPKSDSPTPVPAAKQVPTRRSEALEAELAMLEAILPPETGGSAQPVKVEPPKDSGDTR